MQRDSAAPTLNFLILAFVGDNPLGLFAMAAKTVVTQRFILVLRAVRQKCQGPFCTSVYRQAIFDLLVRHWGQNVYASHHTDPLPEFRPLLGAAFPCTNQFRSLPGNTRVRSSVWTRERPHEQHRRGSTGRNGVVKTAKAQSLPQNAPILKEVFGPMWLARVSWRLFLSRRTFS
jgi:hypothetical protein